MPSAFVQKSDSPIATASSVACRSDSSSAHNRYAGNASGRAIVIGGLSTRNVGYATATTVSAAAASADSVVQRPTSSRNPTTIETTKKTGSVVVWNRIGSKPNAAPTKLGAPSA